jgi:adenine phosphoribosyltransferase
VTSRGPGAQQPAWASLIRDVPDYPVPGVLFKDISLLLADPTAFRHVVAGLSDAGRDADGVSLVDKVVGVEARGFMLAAPVALALDAGLVPVRKAGKLPRETYTESYALEYGEATLQIHQDALAPGDRVLVVDDVLATGGTVAATSRLVARAGASVARVVVLIELAYLHGRDRLTGLAIRPLLTID